MVPRRENTSFADTLKANDMLWLPPQRDRGYRVPFDMRKPRTPGRERVGEVEPG